MGYNYEQMRKEVFTTEGYRMLDIIKNKLIKMNKDDYVTTLDLMKGLCGDSWTMIACIDYLEETQVIYKIADGRASQYDLWMIKQ